MRKLLVFLFLITNIGCSSLTFSSWAPPKDNGVICSGNVCCYPANEQHMMCVSSEPANKNVIIYIKIIEK